MCSPLSLSDRPGCGGRYGRGEALVCATEGTCLVCSKRSLSFAQGFSNREPFYSITWVVVKLTVSNCCGTGKSAAEPPRCTAAVEALNAPLKAPRWAMDGLGELLGCVATLARERFFSREGVLVMELGLLPRKRARWSRRTGETPKRKRVVVAKFRQSWAQQHAT